MARCACGYPRGWIERRFEERCYTAAVTACCEVMPDAALDKARAQVTQPICWASVDHNAWVFGRG